LPSPAAITLPACHANACLRYATPFRVPPNTPDCPFALPDRLALALRYAPGGYLPLLVRYDTRLPTAVCADWLRHFCRIAAARLAPPTNGIPSTIRLQPQLLWVLAYAVHPFYALRFVMATSRTRAGCLLYLDVIKRSNGSYRHCRAGTHRPQYRCWLPCHSRTYCQRVLVGLFPVVPTQFTVAFAGLPKACRLLAGFAGTFCSSSLPARLVACLPLFCPTLHLYAQFLVPVCGVGASRKANIEGWMRFPLLFAKISRVTTKPPASWYCIVADCGRIGTVQALAGRTVMTPGKVKRALL